MTEQTLIVTDLHHDAFIPSLMSRESPNILLARAMIGSPPAARSCDCTGSPQSAERVLSLGQAETPIPTSRPVGPFK